MLVMEVLTLLLKETADERLRLPKLNNLGEKVNTSLALFIVLPLSMRTGIILMLEL